MFYSNAQGLGSCVSPVYYIIQVELVEQLCGVATAVKNARDSHRQTTLVQELKMVVDKFIGEFRLPLNPSLLVKDIDIEVNNVLLVKSCMGLG